MNNFKRNGVDKMCDKELKTLIYSSLENGLTPNEIIEKHNLKDYKRKVQGCYVYFRTKRCEQKQEIKPKLEEENEKLQEKLNKRIEMISLITEYLEEIVSEKPHSINTEIEQYSTLRQCLIHNIEAGIDESEYDRYINNIQLISQNRRILKYLYEMTLYVKKTFQPQSISQLQQLFKNTKNKIEAQADFKANKFAYKNSKRLDAEKLQILDDII
jgi:hypothetical protein